MNEFYKTEADKIDVNAINRDMKQLFENMKMHKSLPTGKANSHRRPEQLAQHFQLHFDLHNQTADAKPESFVTSPGCIIEFHEDTSEALINENRPTLQEIRAVICILKSQKSSTDISVEVLKCLNNVTATLKELEKLFAKVWSQEEIPQKFGQSEITSIWKNKRKKFDPHNYRGIEISSLIGKIFSINLVKRMKIWYDLQLLDFQNGFQPMLPL